MLPVLNSSVGSDEKRLRQIFNQLDERDKETLLRFADFLAASSEPLYPTGKLPAPEVIERPAQENVIQAIKRLTATYPMINKDKLLHQTSELMTAHLINGKPVTEVVDQLEALFSDHYQQLKKAFEQN